MDRRPKFTIKNITDPVTKMRVAYTVRPVMLYPILKKCSFGISLEKIELPVKLLLYQAEPISIHPIKVIIKKSALKSCIIRISLIFFFSIFIKKLAKNKLHIHNKLFIALLETPPCETSIYNDFASNSPIQFIHSFSFLFDGFHSCSPQYMY